MSGKYALIIANTEYSDPALAKLSAPGKDAEELARVLRSRDICGFDDVNILLNESEPVVRDTIDAFFDLKKPDDLLLLYFSGHGVRDEQGALYLAVKNTNRFRLRATAIKSEFIRESMDQSRSKRQVLILDCCNSGAFSQGAKAVTGGSVGTATAFEGTGYGHVVLTASDSTQFAWEGDKIIGETQNSLFTYFLIKGLDGEADINGDGRISVDEIYDYAYDQILKVTPKQTPSKWSYKEQGEIILRESIPVENIKPIALSEQLISEIENNYPEVRLSAIQQLAKLLMGKHIGLARSARAALERMEKEDDSKRVAQAATQALESIRAADKMAEEERKTREEAERIAVQNAEKERKAGEEAERIGLLKAEEGRLAREKADRLAREEAAKSARTQAEREAREREEIRVKAEREAARRRAVREPALRKDQAVAKQASVGKIKPSKVPWLLFGILGTVTVIVGIIVGIKLLQPGPNSNPPFQPTPSSSVLQFQPILQNGMLKIVSSLPMTGSSLTQTQTIVNSEQLRLAQANNQACGGKYTLAYEAWDDASAALGTWDPAIETENAHKAAADPSIIAYLGTFNSGAAKLSIPILNQADLVMISPANTYAGLTKSGLGDAGEPDKYYPNKTRNYARVVTADDVQGKVDANFMFYTLGVQSVYILDDQQLYGKGVADVFEKRARELGMTVVGHEGIDPKAADYKALMTKISTSSAGGPPDGIFVGMVVDSNASQLVKDKVAIMGDNTGVKYMGPDGIQTQAMINGAGASAEGVYASVAGLPFDKWNAVGQKFLADYQAKYGNLTEPYSIYGYETMNVLLRRIEDICAQGGDPSDRKQVLAAIMTTKDFDGVLGTWSFDENGDTTLSDMTVYQVRDGIYVGVGTYR